jgi:Bax protein
MKKVAISTISIILLSACSTTVQTSKVQRSQIVEPSITLETVETKPKIEKEEKYNNIFIQCKQCDNPSRLQHYFNSIDYNLASKTSALLIKDITKGLFKTQDTKLKKEVFFKSIYPLAYRINKEINAEKVYMNNGKNIDKLFKKYKVDNMADLKIRLDNIPVSMIMAQAAIESAYGTSRFAEEGNALFGQWTTNPNGMTPREKPNSKWKVARFKTPLDSTRAYALNVNTNRTYINFRKLRSEGKDPIYGLDKYSQKGSEYIDIIKSVIKSNHLEKFEE